jgi:hypothetical protein
LLGALLFSLLHAALLGQLLGTLLFGLLHTPLLGQLLGTLLLGLTNAVLLGQLLGTLLLGLLQTLLLRHPLLRFLAHGLRLRRLGCPAFRERMLTLRVRLLLAPDQVRVDLGGLGRKARSLGLDIAPQRCLGVRPQGGILRLAARGQRGLARLVQAGALALCVFLGDFVFRGRTGYRRRLLARQRVGGGFDRRQGQVEIRVLMHVLGDHARVQTIGHRGAARLAALDGAARRRRGRGLGRRGRQRRRHDPIDQREALMCERRRCRLRRHGCWRRNRRRQHWGRCRHRRHWG